MGRSLGVTPNPLFVNLIFTRAYEFLIFGWVEFVWMSYITNTKQLLATDILVLVTMKSAAKCDT